MFRLRLTEFLAYRLMQFAFVLSLISILIFGIPPLAVRCWQACKQACKSDGIAESATHSEEHSYAAVKWMDGSIEKIDLDSWCESKSGEVQLNATDGRVISLHIKNCIIVREN